MNFDINAELERLHRILQRDQDDLKVWAKKKINDLHSLSSIMIQKGLEVEDINDNKVANADAEKPVCYC